MSERGVSFNWGVVRGGSHACNISVCICSINVDARREQSGDNLQVPLAARFVQCVAPHRIVRRAASRQQGRDDRSVALSCRHGEG